MYWAARLTGVVNYCNNFSFGSVPTHTPAVNTLPEVCISIQGCRKTVLGGPCPVSVSKPFQFQMEAWRLANSLSIYFDSGFVHHIKSGACDCCDDADWGLQWRSWRQMSCKIPFPETKYCYLQPCMYILHHSLDEGKNSCHFYTNIAFNFFLHTLHRSLLKTL